MYVDETLYKKLVTEKLMTRTKEEIIATLLKHIPDYEVDEVIRETYENEEVSNGEN